MASHIEISKLNSYYVINFPLISLTVFATYLFFNFYSLFQSMGSFPSFFSSSLHLEKCLHPKKPLLTESGEG